MTREEVTKLLKIIGCNNLEMTVRLEPYYSTIDYAIKALEYEQKESEDKS